jgi:hypothetical protein
MITEWNMMRDSEPQPGEGRFLVMGVKGGLYIAKEYMDDSIFFGRCFRTYNGNYVEADKVVAWAEVPTLDELMSMRERGGRR